LNNSGSKRSKIPNGSKQQSLIAVFGQCVLISCPLAGLGLLWNLL